LGGLRRRCVPRQEFVGSELDRVHSNEAVSCGFDSEGDVFVDLVHRIRGVHREGLGYSFASDGCLWNRGFDRWLWRGGSRVENNESPRSGLASPRIGT
jgi:hypothetical protein